MDNNEKVINDILNSFNTKTIVEIGSGNVSHTKQLAKYLKKKDQSKLISIEPNSNLILNNMGRIYDINFIHYHENSLDILDTLTEYDAIFIDDDPNWYTVYNELLTIEKSTKNYPLIFVCNLKYPNKRRDSYYCPENIPEQYIHEYDKKLVLSYDMDESVKYIELDNTINYAIYENSDKNGVLTAIEDYVNDSPLDIKFQFIDTLKNVVLLYKNENDTKINTILSKYANTLNISDFDKLEKYDYLIDYIEQKKYPLFEINEELSITNDALCTELRIKRTQIAELNKKTKYHEMTIEYLYNKTKWYTWILNIIPYVYILIKSRPLKEIPLNYSLYKEIKNNKWFDIGFYITNYPDLSNKWIKLCNPQLHYVCNGFNENRIPHENYTEKLTKKELIKKLKGN